MTSFQAVKGNESQCSKFELCNYGLCIILIFTIICSIGMFSKYRESQQDFEKMFTEFMRTYDKRYATLEERNQRFEIFIGNLKYHEEEKRHRGIDLGVTQFSDWTDSEIQSLLLKKTNKINKTIPRAKFNTLFSPDNFDLRNLTENPPIRNQGGCGACWAFSTVAAVEILISIRNKKLMDLSEQALVDCDRQSYGCDGGCHIDAMSFIKNVGLCTEEEYRYTGTNGRICSMNLNHSRVYIERYVQLDNGEDSIAHWIYKNGPVAFVMNITKSLWSYRSGIFHPTLEDCQTKSWGYHAMTIVGYGVSQDIKPYWIVRNSWGDKWGENGYMKLARGVNICGMTTSVIAPILK